MFDPKIVKLLTYLNLTSPPLWN